MSTEQDRVTELATVLGLAPAVLERHLIRPLDPPMARFVPAVDVPEICQRILAITDGFWLFGTESWDGFRFWSAQDYLDCGNEILGTAVDDGLFPFVGDVPHLASIRMADGAIVSSDWEVYRQPEHGWGRIIAPDLRKYLRTLVHVREQYGYDEPYAKDWWHPYAMHGDRYDLEE